MKKIFWIIGIAAVLIIGFVLLRGSEDDWIKDSRGVYVKHGNPAGTPSYVVQQLQALNCVSELYHNASSSGMNFSSQCLGTCGDYAVDIVHVPRTSEDNLAENQCADFSSGKLKKFIELDKSGNVVRVV